MKIATSGKVALVVGGLALALALPGWAAPVTFNFQTLANGSMTGLNTDLGSNDLFFQGSDGSTVLEAFALTCDNCVSSVFDDPDISGPNLYLKSSSNAVESGLGLMGSSDHEINIYHAIVFDLNSSGVEAEADSFLGPVTVTLGSLQTGEKYYIYGLQGAGDGTELASSSGGNLVTVSVDASAYPYLAITSGGNDNTGDILVSQLTATPSTVPEPATLWLFGTALLLGFVAVRRYRFAADWRR